MKRPRAHVIEDESEDIFKSFLPNEWIVRKKPKDYGIDYEVEIVEGDVVTGNRFWFQLKGTESIAVRTHRLTIPEEFKEDLVGREYLDVKYIAFKADAKLLKYALRCDFPLLLGVIDVPGKEVYWLPLRDEIEGNVKPNNPGWKEQKSVTVRIPMHNTFSEEKKRDYYGLRWYAMEPARMRAFATMHHYYHELQYESRLSGYVIGEGFIDYSEEAELIQSLRAAKSYLQMALQLDSLFGERGLDICICVTKPLMEEGLKACDQLLQDIPEGRVSFLPTSMLIGKVSHAVSLMPTCISMYQDFRKRFIFTEEGVFWSEYLKNKEAGN